MGYKLLGFIVWQGAKLFIRRHNMSVAGKAAFIAVGAAVVAGAAVAAKQAGNRQQP